MSSSRARTPLALVVLLVVSVLGLAACSGGGGDEASSSSTTAAAPTTVAPVTTQPGESDQCPGFRGSTTMLTSSGPTAPAFLTDATAGAQGCLDVVTFTFQSRGDGTPPGYTVRYRDQAKEPFQDGDQDILIDGAATLFVSITPAASVDMTGVEPPDPTAAASADSNGDGIDDNTGEPIGGSGGGGGGGTPTYTGNLSLSYGDHHHLVIVRELPDAKDAAGQDSVNWVIGLDSVRPFRVDRAENPTRVTILIG